MGMTINIPEHIRALLDGHITEEMQARLVSNLIYMPALMGYTLDGAERPGHSSQAPDGAIRPNVDEITVFFESIVNDALIHIANGMDPQKAFESAMVEGIAFAANRIVPDTPIDTGRARTEWRLVLPPGVDTSTTDQMMAEMSPSVQLVSEKYGKRAHG